MSARGAFRRPELYMSTRMGVNEKDRRAVLDIQKGSISYLIQPGVNSRTCPHCGKIQGEFYLFHEQDSPFFGLDEPLKDDPQSFIKEFDCHRLQALVGAEIIAQLNLFVSPALSAVPSRRRAFMERDK